MTMPRRTTLTRLWAASLGLVLLAGCADTSRRAAFTPVASLPAARLHGHVTVWSWSIAAESLEALTPTFERRDPGVQVDVDMTGAQMLTRLMLSLASGVGAPDACQLQDQDAPHFIATGQLADLTPVAGQYRAQFPPAVWANCTQGGHVYAIPWDIGPCGVFYKRAVFQRYGVDPAKIQTWNDYIRAGQRITRLSGGRTRMLPLGTGDLMPMFEMLLQQTGGQVFDSRGRVAINSTRAAQALDVIRRLRAAGICADVPEYSQEWMAGFGGDGIATYPGAVWLSGMIADTVGVPAGADGGWGVFRLPAVAPGGPHVAALGGSVLAIPAQCPDKAAAWAFIQYALCTRAGQLAQYRSEKLFPAYLPALASPDMDARDPFFGGRRVAHLFADGVTGIPPLNRTAAWAEATGYVSQALSHWAATGMPQGGFLDSLAQTLHRRLDVPLALPQGGTS